MTFASIEDLRQAARRQLPRAIFEFIDGGAQDEVTLRANLADFHRLALMPRALTDVSKRDQSVTVLGQRYDSPLILAPTGLPGVVWPNGAMEAAVAADRRGSGLLPVAPCRPPASRTYPAASTRPVWFQLYVMRDRELAKSMMQRAKAAGCSVLVITVDLQMQGQRDRDVRNGLTIPPQFRMSNAIDFALHPGWVWRFLTGPKVTLANFVGTGKGDDMFTIAGFVNSQFDQSVTWKDIDWVRAVWDGPIGAQRDPEPRGC